MKLGTSFLDIHQLEWILSMYLQVIRYQMPYRWGDVDNVLHNMGHTLR